MTSPYHEHVEWRCWCTMFGCGAMIHLTLQRPVDSPEMPEGNDPSRNADMLRVVQINGWGIDTFGVLCPAHLPQHCGRLAQVGDQHG